MPENIGLYLDQMFQTHVARVLRQTGYNVIRASEVGHRNHLVILSSNREKWVCTE